MRRPVKPRGGMVDYGQTFETFNPLVFLGGGFVSKLTLCATVGKRIGGGSRSYRFV